MTESEAKHFVQRFEAAWRTFDGAAFLALWHEDGQLRSPFYDRVICGRELGLLNDFQRANAPGLTWRLVSWTWHDDIVMVEWESSNRYGEQVVSWRGVDKFTLRDGKVIEEIVYADTGPLQARRQGKTFDPLIRVPA